MSEPSTAGRRRGFTLIELLVVLIVLAVLAAVAVPTYTHVVNTAKDRVALVELQALNRQAWALATAQSANGYTLADFDSSQGATGAAPGLAAAGGLLVSTDHVGGDPNAALTSTGHGRVAVGCADASGSAAACSSPQPVAGLAMRSDYPAHCVYLRGAAGNPTTWIGDYDAATGCSATVAIAGPGAASPAPSPTPAPGVSVHVASNGPSTVAVFWSPPAGSTPTSYTVYRNGALVGGGPMPGQLYIDSPPAGSSSSYTVADHSSGSDTALSSTPAVFGGTFALPEIGLSGATSGASATLTWTTGLASANGPATPAEFLVFRDGIQLADLTAAQANTTDNAGHTQTTSTWTDTGWSSADVHYTVVGKDSTGAWHASNRLHISPGVTYGAWSGTVTTTGFLPGTATVAIEIGSYANGSTNAYDAATKTTTTCTVANPCNVQLSGFSNTDRMIAYQVGSTTTAGKIGGDAAAAYFYLRVRAGDFGTLTNGYNYGPGGTYSPTDYFKKWVFVDPNP